MKNTVFAFIFLASFFLTTQGARAQFSGSCDATDMQCSLQAAQADLDYLNSAMKSTGKDHCKRNNLFVQKQYAEWLLNHRNDFEAISESFNAVPKKMQAIASKPFEINPVKGQDKAQAISFDMAMQFLQFYNTKVRSVPGDAGKKVIADAAEKPDFSPLGFTLSQAKAALNEVNTDLNARIAEGNITQNLSLKAAGFEQRLMINFRVTPVLSEAGSFTSKKGSTLSEFSFDLDLGEKLNDPIISESALWKVLLENDFSLGDYPLRSRDRYIGFLLSHDLGCNAYDSVDEAFNAKQTIYTPISRFNTAVDNEKFILSRVDQVHGLVGTYVFQTRELTLPLFNMKKRKGSEENYSLGLGTVYGATVGDSEYQFKFQIRNAQLQVVPVKWTDNDHLVGKAENIQDVYSGKLRVQFGAKTGFERTVFYYVGKQLCMATKQIENANEKVWPIYYWETVHDKCEIPLNPQEE